MGEMVRLNEFKPPHNLILIRYPFLVVTRIVQLFADKAGLTSGTLNNEHSNPGKEHENAHIQACI